MKILKLRLLQHLLALQLNLRYCTLISGSLFDLETLRNLLCKVRLHHHVLQHHFLEGMTLRRKRFSQWRDSSNE